MPRWSTLSREEQRAQLDALIAAKFAKKAKASIALAVAAGSVRRSSERRMASDGSRSAASD